MLSTPLKERMIRLLRETANKIENNTCELSEDEAIDMLSILAHQPLSKEQAYNYIHLKRSRFDDLVREGKIPKGRKRRGFNELVWYKDELDSVDIEN